MAANAYCDRFGLYVGSGVAHAGKFAISHSNGT